MDLNAYLHMDACTVAAHIKKGKVSPEEALSFAIERCEQVNPHLNAIRHRFKEWGQQQLKKMSGSERFYGVPLLVKELEPISWRFYQDGLTLSAHQLILAKDRLFQLLDLCKTLKKIGLWQEYPVVSPLLD